MVQQVDHQAHQHVQRHEAQYERADVEHRLPDGLIQVVGQRVDAQALEHLRPHVGLEGLGNHGQLAGDGGDRVLDGGLAPGDHLRHRADGLAMRFKEALRLQILVQHRHQRLVGQRQVGHPGIQLLRAEPRAHESHRAQQRGDKPAIHA